MKEAFKAYLDSVKAICPEVTDQYLAFLEPGLTLSELKPKHFYIHANTLQNEIGFVYRGLLRSFFVNPEGKEITVKFIPENRFATDYTAFISRMPGKYHFQCIEPCTIVNISYDLIQEGYTRFQKFERYGRLVAEEYLKLQQRRIEGFLFVNAEKRYLDFIQENPDLISRISLSHLSSYLGIERQSLTRIRQRLAKL